MTHLLPPYTTTNFDSVLNKIFASFLLPVPDYASSINDKSSTTLEKKSMDARQVITCANATQTDRIDPGSETRRPVAAEAKQLSWLRNVVPSTRRSSTDSDGPVEIPERYAPLSRFSRKWRIARFPLPITLQPSMASTYTTCGVVSCPDRPDELPSMEWTKSMRINGLGKVDINAYSAYVSTYFHGTGGVHGIDHFSSHVDQV